MIQIDSTLLSLACGAIGIVYSGMAVIIAVLWKKVDGCEKMMIRGLAAEEKLDACSYSKCPYRHALLLAAACLLSACTVKPTYVRTPSGAVYLTTGGTLGTKADSETASAVLHPDGSVELHHGRTGGDETAIPRYSIQAQAMGAMSRVAGSVTKHAATQETRRLTERELTTRNADTLRNQTEQLRITTP